MRLRMRPPSNKIVASLAASHRTRLPPPSAAALSDCQPKDPLKDRLGKRAASCSAARAISPCSVNCAARTSGRWRILSAGTPTAKSSGAFGRGLASARRSRSAPGGWPARTARRCSACARLFSRPAAQKGRCEPRRHTPNGARRQRVSGSTMHHVTSPRRAASPGGELACACRSRPGRSGFAGRTQAAAQPESDVPATARE